MGKSLSAIQILKVNYINFVFIKHVFFFLFVCDFRLHRQEVCLHERLAQPPYKSIHKYKYTCVYVYY